MGVITVINLPKVFISYSHESEQIDKKVLRFSNKLRQDYSIDAMIDQYIEVPIEGWPLWMERQIETSDFVLIVCTKSYFEKIEDCNAKKGKGAIWEMGIVRQSLYDSFGLNTKFIPIMFDEYAINYIPKPLKGTTYYNISKIKDLRILSSRILGIEFNIKPPITGNRLYAMKPKTIFIPPVINHTLWDKAGWFSIIYLYDITGERAGRIMLFLKEKKAAEWIFQELSRLEENGYINALQVTFIKGKKGDAKYWLKLGVNVKYFEEYLRKNDLKDSLVICPYTYRWYNIDPYNDLTLFYTEQAYLKHGYLEMSYISSKENSKNILKIRNVLFKTFESIDSDDPDFEIINNSSTKKSTI